MNAKDVYWWLEDRGNVLVIKSDGGNFIVSARDAGGVLKSAEAPTLAEAVMMWEEL